MSAARLSAIEPSPITRSSVRVLPAATPLRCLSCSPSSSPHTADFEIRYRRGPLRVALRVCDTAMPYEVARLLKSDVAADDDEPAGVAIDAPVRMVRVLGGAS